MFGIKKIKKRETGLFRDCVEGNEQRNQNKRIIIVIYLT